LNGKLVYLGGNRIHCECQTVKNLRVSWSKSSNWSFSYLDFRFRFGDLFKTVTQFFATTCRRKFSN
jgi:hypothetical protein